MTRYTRLDVEMQPDGSLRATRLLVRLCHTRAAERRARRDLFNHLTIREFPAAVRAAKRANIEIVTEEHA